MKKNNEKLKEINDTIKRYSSKGLPKVNLKSEPKPEPEGEKIIFKFNKILINLEKEINDKNDNVLNIQNIKFKIYQVKIIKVL